MIYQQKLNLLENAAFWKNLEKNWLNLVNIEHSAKFWQKFNLRNFGKKLFKQQTIQQFLTKILRLESGAKECIV